MKKILLISGYTKFNTDLVYNILTTINKKNIYIENLYCEKNKKISNFFLKNKIKSSKISIKKLKKIKKGQYDFLLSVWNKFIFSDDFLKKFKNNMNIHPSYLPKYRGSNPLINSILNEDKIGFTFHKMNKNIDEGPIFLKKQITLRKPKPAIELYKTQIKKIYIEFRRTFFKILNGKLKPKIKNKATKLYKLKNFKKYEVTNLDKDVSARKFFISTLAFHFDKKKKNYYL
jgi:methionyl-tRNA formyltransferase